METNCCAKCGDYGFFDSGCKNLYCKCHASVEVNCCKQCAGFEVRTHVIGLNHVPMKPACSNISCTCHKENEVNQTNYWREITHTIIKSGDLVGCDFCKKGDTSVKEYPICAPKMDTFIQKVREEAVREGRKEAVGYIRENIVSIDKKDVTDTLAEFSVVELDNLFEQALGEIKG